VKRILLVEDDDALRGLLRTALTAADYEVDEAADGDAALESIQRRCPDLLLSDLVLPGVNGQELATRCRALCPDLVLVFMSGYKAEELQRRDITQVVFIPKPVAPRELVATIDRLLDH
jgi:DNA-binding response OmpR family regulator